MSVPARRDDLARVAPSGAALRFPDGFLWGAATSAYQIEGATSADGRGQSIWDTFSRIPGKVRDGDTGEVAVDHYHRWREDVALMRELGLRSYRFSVAWPRIQPDGSGPPNERGLDFYRALVDGLLEADIVPVLTLFHWDLPQRLQDAGGWPARETAYRFAEYAVHVLEALGDRVPYWMTMNEPWCASFLGYGMGLHAPGIADLQQAVMAAHHLLLAHGLAVDVMREAGRDHARIGIVLDPQPVRADGPDATDAARQADGMRNRLFLEPIFKATYPADVIEDLAGRVRLDHIRDEDLPIIAAPLDVLGLNYYQPLEVNPSGDGERPRTDMGWEVDPSGLIELLKHIDRTYGPIPLLVTENGAAYDDNVGTDGEIDDSDRTAYLEQHIRAAWDVIQAGVDLRGYFVWSLLDNFEWAEGYARRFGLVYVDYPTQRRILKNSARWYRRVIAANGLDGGPTEPGGA